MTPQKALPIILSAVLVIMFLLSPLRSTETFSTAKKNAISVQVQLNSEQSSNHTTNLDLTIPVNNKKEKESDHSQDLVKNKRHADEDRHEHHHHHFDKVKGRKRIVGILSAILTRILIVISYISILLCSYMSICH